MSKFGGHIDSILETMPDDPGIYQFFNKLGQIIYVGKAKSLKKRVYSYFSKENHDNGKTTILVKNIAELNAANKNAQPGDTIILKNGAWKDVNIRLDCQGSEEKPIVFKAETAGKVMVTGNSKLKIGGTFITVSGLYFTNGFAGKDAVITFRTDKDHLANNCRVTNTSINDFNNPRRMDENNWVLFYGKKNICFNYIDFSI